MVIEWLKFRVCPELRERFIQKDAEIWTPMLASCPGFISKEVWIDPATPTDVVVLIRWETREDWKSIPAEQLAEVEQNFERQFGEPYQIIETAEYQLRKFPVL